jgi:hypothetical protein
MRKNFKANAKVKKGKQGSSVMSSVLDKIRRMKEREPVRTNFSSFRGIFHSWKDADNIVRLVGEMTEVHTHYVCPNPKRGERGLCQGKSFQGEGKIPATVNCLDWDIAKEEMKKDRTCPFCKLSALAKQALKENPNAEEKKFFEALKQASYARVALKWNIIDRDDPYIIKVDNGNEIKVPGLKIATVGKELWRDIEGVFNQCGFDITDTDEGIDICVTKGSGAKTTYAAKAVLFGKPLSVKVTPLTAEERSWDLHDLKTICGKQTAFDLLMDALHPDLRELLDLNSGEEEAAPATPPKSAGKIPRKMAEEEEQDDALGDEDEDAIGGSSGVKKK